MNDKKQSSKNVSKPYQEKFPEVNPLADPEDLTVPDEDPDIIPDEDPFENPPYDEPEPGEGP